MTDWETKAKSLNYEFITDNTCYGLKVSLKASLELLQFLVNECGYTYLMTSRLNQDALEVPNNLIFYSVILKSLNAVYCKVYFCF